MRYKRKLPLRKSIPKKFGSQLDLVIKLLHAHLNRANRELLFNTLKEIQKTSGLSLEYIRNLILSSHEWKANKFTYSKQNKDTTEKIMHRFSELLKFHKIKLEIHPRTYVMWKNDIDLYKVKKQGILRIFKI